VKIRRLEGHDRAEWLRLRQTLWPDYTKQQQDLEMAEILANPATMPVFVAEQPNGDLCGLLEVSLKNWAEGCTGNKIGYLEAWFVDPDWRRQGIGRQLVQAAEAWAMAQGCTEMASDTNSFYPLSPAAHHQNWAIRKSVEQWPFISVRS